MTNEIATITGLNEAYGALAGAIADDDVTTMRDARALGTAMQKGAKARGMGIEAENQACELILRCERAIGQLLIRMAAEGTRAKGGGGVLLDEVQIAMGRGSQSALRGSRPATLPTLASMGIPNARAAWEWQQVAKLEDDTFEDMLAAAIAKSERIAKHNFYRAAKLPIDNGREHSTVEDTDFTTFRAGAHGLLGWTVNDDGTGAPTRNGLLLLPNDELEQLAVLIRELVRAYQEVRVTRA